MADNAPRKGSDFSVRVQVFPHTRTHSRTVHYLKAYRLRLKGDSTFAELGRLTLARYAKDDLESGCRARVGCISDERDCVVDMEERVNLIEPGEVLKLVLAPPRFPAPSSISNKVSTRGSSFHSLTNPRSQDTGLASKSTIYPSQTPAVKNVRPRTPAVLLALTNKPSQSTQASTTATQNPKPLLKPMGAMPDQAGLIVARSSQCNGTGKKRDPYEIPSDSEHMNMSRGHNQAPSIQTQEPGNPMLIQSAMRVATRSTTSGVRTVSIKDFPASFDESQESSRNGSTTRGKCAAPHTINSHLSIVEDKVVSTNGDEVQPAYRVKTSRGIVPVFIRGMCSDTRSITNGVMTSSASSNKSMRSSKSSESIGPLTLTPSRLPQALNDYQDMLQYKIDKRDDETQRAAKQEAELKESRGKAKAQSRKNLPFATTSHLKSITKTTFHRKSKLIEPKRS